MVTISVSATWGKPAEPVGIWNAIYSVKWILTGSFGVLLGILLVAWFKVKAAKVILTGVAGLIIALVFPHEPLLAFSAGIVGLSARLCHGHSSC